MISQDLWYRKNAFKIWKSYSRRKHNIDNKKERYAVLPEPSCTGADRQHSHPGASISITPTETTECPGIQALTPLWEGASIIGRGGNVHAGSQSWRRNTFEGFNPRAILPVFVEEMPDDRRIVNESEPCDCPGYWYVCRINDVWYYNGLIRD